MKTKYIILKESFIESVLSDLFTFGMLALMIWLSSGSRFWSVICFGMFIWSTITTAMKRENKPNNRCDSPEELIEYAKRLIEERDLEKIKNALTRK